MRYRCVGNNCTRSWALPRNKSRVLKHACHCHRLPSHLRAEANSLKSGESLGALVEQLECEIADERVSSKRIRIDGENNPSDSTTETFMDIYVGETGRKRLQAMLDLAVVNFICATAIPPTVVDYAEWKKIFTIANIRYHPKSSQIIVDDHIPGQAARARELSLKYLGTQVDLTISYDGATTKKPQSVYTIHFTTPDGRSFLIEGQEASDESHTGEHIADQLLRAMDLIGRHHFSGISGDSTGNTKLARIIVCNAVNTIINLPDICHHTSLACKDICRLPIFADVW